MALEDAWRCVDDVAGTSVDTFCYMVERGDGLFYPSKVGGQFGSDMVDSGFWLVAFYRAWHNMKSLEERVVDQVVVENGVRPDERLYYALKEGSRNKGQIDVEALFAIQPQPCLSQSGEGYLLFRIGDCVAQRNTHAAIYDALRLCKDF